MGRVHFLLMYSSTKCSNKQKIKIWNCILPLEKLDGYADYFSFLSFFLGGGEVIGIFFSLLKYWQKYGQNENIYVEYMLCLLRIDQINLKKKFTSTLHSIWVNDVTNALREIYYILLHGKNAILAIIIINIS